MSSNFPWERVGDKVLRLLLEDLGIPAKGLRRTKLIEHLETMEADGMDAVLHDDSSVEDSPPKSQGKRRRSSRAQSEPERKKPKQRTSKRHRPAPSYQILTPGLKFDCVLVPPTSFKSKGKARAAEARSSEPPEPSEDEEDDFEDEHEDQADKEHADPDEEDGRERELRRGRSFKGRLRTYKSRRSHSRRSEVSMSSEHI